jgi:PAS domain S-box-containing protein
MNPVPSPRPLSEIFKSRIWPYLFAIVSVAVATALTRLTFPWLGELSSLFFVAVVLSTWYGGLGPGLLATVLAGAACASFTIDIPPGSGLFGADDALRLAVFLLACAVMSSLVHLRRRAEQELRNANEGLEQRVQERTRELESSSREARESEERFRALMEGVADYAICMLDAKGHVISWNSGAQRIQGYRQSEIFGRDCSLFYTAESRLHNKPDEHLQAAAALGRVEDEGWRVRKDQSRFWANVIITPLHDEKGELRGFAHVTRDITELKRLEKEVLEISEKEQQRIGHDLHDGLGQELTGVSFLSQNLRRRLAEQSLPEAAEAMRISELSNQAIEQVRELARGLSPVELGSDGLIAALRVLSDKMCQTYGITCTMQVSGAVRVEDHAAAVHLYRITQEALTNAMRHSGASAIVIRLEQDNREISLSVEDNGVGLPEPRDGGKGLGLHLMLYRAKMIGATLGIAGRPGGGTVVRWTYRNSTDGEPIRGTSDPNLRDSLEQRPHPALENSARR